MKLNYKNLKDRIFKTSSNQERMIEFIKDKKNVEKAAEGSMQKRIDMFKKAELSR